MKKSEDAEDGETRSKNLKLHNYHQTNKYINSAWQIFTDDENWQFPMHSEGTKDAQHWLILDHTYFTYSVKLTILIKNVIFFFITKDSQ